MRVSHRPTISWTDVAPRCRYFVDFILFDGCSINFNVIFLLPHIFYSYELGGLLPQLIHVANKIHAFINKQPHMQVVNHIV